MDTSNELPISRENAEMRLASGASGNETVKTSSVAGDDACYKDASKNCTRVHARESNGGAVSVGRPDGRSVGRRGGGKEDNGDGLREVKGEVQRHNRGDSKCPIESDNDCTSCEGGIDRSGTMEDGESDLEGDSDRVCLFCGEVPCDWATFGKDLLDSGEDMFPKESAGENSVRRKALCRLHTCKKYGHLGKGNRVPIPKCVQDRIRDKWPEANSELCMGFREN